MVDCSDHLPEYPREGKVWDEEDQGEQISRLHWEMSIADGPFRTSCLRPLFVQVDLLRIRVILHQVDGGFS